MLTLNNKKILVVGAHPDDLELSCFGTLMKIREASTIHAVVLTGGGQSYETESREAIKPLKLKSIEFHDFKMGELPVNWDSVTVVDRLIEKYDIDVIITHAEWDTHQDHVVAEKIVRAATRRRPVSVIAFHAISSTPEFRPNMIVDISYFLEMKIEAAQCFESWKGKIYLEKDFLREWHHDKVATSAGLHHVELFHIYRSFM